MRRSPGVVSSFTRTSGTPSAALVRCRDFFRSTRLRRSSPYEGVAEVSRRVEADVALLFVGAARVREVGPAHLTFTAAQAVEAARAFVHALVVPSHFEGRAHFAESRAEIQQAFDAAGLADRLRWLPAGRRLDLSDA
jgi:hypothetical protein